MDAWLGPEMNSIVKCQTCGVIVRKVNDEILANYDWLVDFSIGVCKSKFLNVDNADEVCPGIVPFMAGPVVDMITSSILTQLRVCNEFLGFCNSPKVDTLEIADY